VLEARAPRLRAGPVAVWGAILVAAAAVADAPAWIGVVVGAGLLALARFASRWRMPALAALAASALVTLWMQNPPDSRASRTATRGRSPVSSGPGGHWPRDGAGRPLRTGAVAHPRALASLGRDAGPRAGRDGAGLSRAARARPGAAALSRARVSTRTSASCPTGRRS
jgi:hypothetical protein